jgi:hypothetical protein
VPTGLLARSLTAVRAIFRLPSLLRCRAAPWGLVKALLPNTTMDLPLMPVLAPHAVRGAVRAWASAMVHTGEAPVVNALRAASRLTAQHLPNCL